MKKGNSLLKVMFTRFTQTMLNVSHELNVKDVVDIYLVSKQNTAEERVNAGKEGPSHTISISVRMGKSIKLWQKIMTFS